VSLIVKGTRPSSPTAVLRTGVSSFISRASPSYFLLPGSCAANLVNNAFLVYSPIVHHPDHNYVKFLWQNHESAMLDLRKFLSDKGVLRRSCLLQCIPLVLRPSKSYLSAYDAVANFSLRGFSNEYRSCTVDGIQYEMSWHELYDPQLYAHNHPSHVRPYKSPPTAKSEFSNYVLGYPH